MKHWKALAVSLAISLGTAGLTALLTKNAMKVYQALNQPKLAPPGWLFPPVWTLLFLLMGISAWMVWKTASSRLRSRALWVYGLQLAVNAGWSLIFFLGQKFWAALVVLVLLEVLILRMIWLFYRVRPAAGWLQVPYFLWVFFAGYLNLMVARLNP